MNEESVLTEIRGASATIQHVAEQLNRKEIDPAVAIEIFRKEILKLEPILQPYSTEGMTWSPEIRDFVIAVHNTGVRIPFIEELLRLQGYKE
jgi:hypothetical protein